MKKKSVAHQTKINADNFELLDIDPNNLDKEWLNQPRFFFRYASELADARRDHESAKAELKVVAAQKSNRFRKKAAIKGEKTTESQISSLVQSNSDYVLAEQQMIAARHRMDVLDAAVTALEHRKHALENMVRLHGQSYFATPRSSSDNKDVVENSRKKNIRSRTQK